MSTPPPPPPLPQGGYGPPPSQPTGKRKLRGRIPLRLSLIFGVIGVALCVVGVVLIASSPVFGTDEFARVDVDREQSVTLNRTGHTVVYFETPANGSHDATVETVELTDPSGKPVPVKDYDNTLTYDTGKRHAEAVLTFEAPAKGTYRVSSRFEDVPPGAQLAFGESVVGGIVTGVLLFIPGLLLLIAAVVLLIVGLVKRSRHKRELASVYAGGHGPNDYPGQ